MRALAFHRCGSGSIPGLDAICGLSLLLVLFSALREVPLQIPIIIIIIIRLTLKICPTYNIDSVHNSNLLDNYQAENAPHLEKRASRTAHRAPRTGGSVG